MTENKCGGCTMCCRLLGIPELKKPVGEWCLHCKKGVGCNIYDSRPNSCIEFECLYRQGLIPSDLNYRPDKSKVVFATASNGMIAAFVDPNYPNAWEKEPIYTVIKAIVNEMGKLVVGWGESQRKVLLERVGPQIITRKEITMTPPDESGMQWYNPDYQKGD